MKKSHLMLIALLFICGFKASAQEYEVPKDYVLKTNDDYPKYEADVIKTVDWLQQTSWNEQADKRKEAEAFLVVWLSGSPNVSIDIQPPLMKLVDKNVELLTIYMGNYAKYALEHKDTMDKDAANTFAIRAMINKYNNEPTHVKNSVMEKLTEIDKKGKLDDWVKNVFNKSK